MDCKHCGSKNLQVISEYVELPEKKPFSLFVALKFLSILLMILSGILLIIGASACHANSELTLAHPFLLIPLITFCISLFMLLAVEFAKLFQPYEHVTNIAVVCMDCGKSWVLSSTSSKK